ncbi:DUF2157 domain-containing protein [bacterium]|nr:DUF2157 domain-containing protein [bacterium]
MEKQELLKSIQASLERGIITRDDLINLSDLPEVRSAGKRGDRLNISEILYYLGGLIVFIGIAIFVGENWERLNSVGKILATLGVGIAMYISGILLSQYKNLERPAIGFHLIAALLIPGGIFVTLDVANVSPTLGLATLVFAALTVFYLVTYKVYPKNLFLFLSILFGTALYFLFTDYLSEDNLALLNSDLYLYRVGVLGLAYLLFGYSFSQESNESGGGKGKAPSLIGLLNSLGVVLFLGATFALGGSGIEKNMFWEIIFPALALGVIFLSIEVKSRGYLIFGTLFLMGYIFKITADYFADSIGWSLALVLLGFAFIGIGYLSVMLNNKYLRKK